MRPSPIIALAALAALAVIAVLAAACGGGGGDDGDSERDTIEEGDCLIYRATGDVAEVYCTEPHDAEVTAVLDMPPGPFPGDRAINQFAIDNCPDGIDTFIYPTERSWSVGDRRTICLEEDLGTPASPASPDATTTPAPGPN